MSTRENLAKFLDSLPEERLKELLDFAQFLSLKEERDQWHRSGVAYFATCYGPNEPDYGELTTRPSKP
jgi:hypothetical protein